MQKILSRAGIASRRTAEKLITSGRVRINGARAELGDKAVPGIDSLEVDGIPVPEETVKRYYILNKPAGVVTTTDDPQGRTTVLDCLEGEAAESFRLFPVGRLDMDSSGLILLTNDGFLANRVMHPSFEVPREYLVDVEPVPRSGDLSRLRKGVELEEGNSGPAKVALLATSEGRARVKMVVHTGRKRQIRRSFELLGYSVIRLNRTRIGPVGLGNLPPGQARRLNDGEVSALYSSTGLKR